MTRTDIVRMFAERQQAIEQRDVATIAKQHALECEHISLLAGGSVKGREAIGKLYETWFKGFPDSDPLNTAVRRADDAVDSLYHLLAELEAGPPRWVQARREDIR